METVEYVSHIYLRSCDGETDFYAPGIMTEHKVLRNSFLRDYYRRVSVSTRVFVKYRCFRLTIAETGDVCKVRKTSEGAFSFIKIQEK